MSAEKEKIEALKKEDQDTTGLEANSLDEQARRYFRRMVSCSCGRFHPRICEGSHLGRRTGMRLFWPSGSASEISVSPGTRRPTAD